MDDEKSHTENNENGEAGETAPRTSAPSRRGEGGRRRINPRSPRQAIQPELAAPPPTPSRRANHPLVVVMNFFIMIVMLVLIGGGAALYFGRQRFLAPGPLTDTKTVLIARGSDLQRIASQLKQSQVVSSDFLFATGVKIYKAQDKLKAGEYLFKPGMSMRDVLDALVSGRSILHSITFPEGLTSQQIVDRLKADDTLSGDIQGVPAEGTLLPETYKFTIGTPRQQIIDEMERAEQRAVSDIWERKSQDLPISRDQLVTLASIVEKETGKADERPRVAAVFINRLQKKMRLQSDPTIIYGLFGGKGKPTDYALTRSDITKATPYNTYVIQGLPPTPIANPGRAAIEAVANPSRTDELYFVADGTGGHVFASSLDEHNKNVARWRKLQDAQGGNAAKPTPEATPAVGRDADPATVPIPKPAPQ
ncbi:UPF0755 protein [Faunimonas pinastri]|uniref:Endolytic murein transglycosylase n=1 Tax=Faunimonas pinastri TaxID=1855383 RepID=A0A1H9DCP2_9HYPH|nr:endolytic transglycosylase MltG [Faunimonas pinastri]SEQ11077.1 UPF0755 protein [Faunimonas pinastri]